MNDELDKQRDAAETLFNEMVNGMMHQLKDRTRAQIFAIANMSLMLLESLVEEAGDNVRQMAALALTDAALARRDREQTERTVVA